jgi:hypothetical protein
MTEAMHQFSLRSRVVGRASARSTARQMVAMCPAGGLRGLGLQRSFYFAAAVWPRLALKPIHAWPLPVSEELWVTIDSTVRSSLGIGTGEVLWHLPPADQPQVKFGALILDAAGHPRAFARVLLDATVPQLTPPCSRGRRSGIQWPVRLSEFRISDVAVEVTTRAPTGPHRPAHLGLAGIMDLCDDVAEALDHQEPPAGLSSGWVPMHGDLAHWNLRRYAHNQVFLLDWEACAWAPVHADLVRFIMTAPYGAKLAAEIPSALRPDLEEAVNFWMARRPNTSGGTAPVWVIKKHRAQTANLRALLVGA